MALRSFDKSFASVWNSVFNCSFCLMQKLASQPLWREHITVYMYAFQSSHLSSCQSEKCSSFRPMFVLYACRSMNLSRRASDIHTVLAFMFRLSAFSHHKMSFSRFNCYDVSRPARSLSWFASLFSPVWQSSFVEIVVLDTRNCQSRSQGLCCIQ